MDNSAAAVQIDRVEALAKRYQAPVIRQSSDLPPARGMFKPMAAECRRRKDLVVLENGWILVSDSNSELHEVIQRAKTMLNHASVSPRLVFATETILELLLDNQSQAPADKKSASEAQTLLRELLREAVKWDASDVHIEVRSTVAYIKLRRFGRLEPCPRISDKIGPEIPYSLGDKLCSVAFNFETDAESSEHFNPRIPQDASVTILLDGSEVRLRIASGPANGGYDFVIRVLTTGDTRVPRLPDLGYQDWQTRLVFDAVKRPHGMVVISGPTGSGKTTTLASAMNLIDDDRKILTAEDPVEKQIDNASQMPVVVDDDDRGFAAMVRAMLRMDPDVIMIGEMRDEDTASTAVRAAITGHLVFTTLHVNSATNIVTRLNDLGVSPELLANPDLLDTLVYQRLAPILCQECSKPFSHSNPNPFDADRIEKVFGGAVARLRVRGDGCSHCDGHGVTGRKVIAEIIKVDQPGRDFIREMNILGWEKHLRSNGWSSIQDHAKQLALKGMVDIFEAERATTPFSENLHSAFNYRELMESC